jgi:hypothetical protein
LSDPVRNLYTDPGQFLRVRDEMASKDPKNPGLKIEASPARRAALMRLLGSGVVVKVDPRFIILPG